MEEGDINSFFNIPFDCDTPCLDGLSQNPDFANPSDLIQSPCPGPPQICGSSNLTTSPQENNELLSELPGSTVSGKFNAKAMLLTWSQAPSLSKQLILDHLLSLNNHSVQLLGAVIGQESHEDGGIHFHAAAQWTGPGRKWNPNQMNVQNIHPNIRTHRKGKSTYAESLSRMWMYPQKEDTNPLKWGTQPPPPDAPLTKKRKRAEIFATARDLALTEGTTVAVTHIMTELPETGVKSLSQIQSNLHLWRMLHQTQQPPSYQLSQFKANLVASIPEPLKVLLISGPAGIGKTQFARAILPEAILVRHIDRLKGQDLTKGIIFDDFGVSHMFADAIKHLLDWDEDSDIHVRYGTVHIPRHTQKIFCYNKCFDSWLPTTMADEDYAAIRRRIDLLEIKSKIYL